MAVDAFALILAMLAVGMLFARLRVLPDNAAEVLNQVVLAVCLPAAILLYAPRLRFDLSLFGLVATPWLLAAVGSGAVLLLARWLRFARDEVAVLLLAVVLGNTSFIGFPMVRALLGEEALPYAVVYDQFGSFLLLTTFGLYVLARYGENTRLPPGQIILRMVRFPSTWALVFGLTLMPEQPPAWVASGLQRLADALLPLVMLAVGFSIRLRIPPGELKPLAVGVALKLGVLPVLALGLSLAFGMPPTMFHVNVLESAMPSMATAGALAISHGLAPRLAAALVAYGILLSLVTLPAWGWLIRQFTG